MALASDFLTLHVSCELDVKAVMERSSGEAEQPLIALALTDHHRARDQPTSP